MLSLYFVPDFDAALDTCYALLKFGGLGHTAVIHANDDARIREYALRMPAMRVLVNTPSPQGSTGITTNVFPAMTLGCGAVAGNATSDNIGPLHLINIKRLAYVVRKPEEAFEMPLDTTPRFRRRRPPRRLAVDRGAVVAAVERYLASRGSPWRQLRRALLRHRHRASRLQRSRRSGGPLPRRRTRRRRPPKPPADMAD